MPPVLTMPPVPRTPPVPVDPPVLTWPPVPVSPPVAVLPPLPVSPPSAEDPPVPSVVIAPLAHASPPVSIVASSRRRTVSYCIGGSSFQRGTGFRHGASTSAAADETVEGVVSYFIAGWPMQLSLKGRNRPNDLTGIHFSLHDGVAEATTCSWVSSSVVERLCCRARDQGVTRRVAQPWAGTVNW